MPATKRRSGARIIAALGFAAMAAACAVMQPPPGGPEDKTPPFVVSTIPREDSAGVARDAAPVFFFNEKVDPASFKNRISIFPPVPFDRIRVRGERLEISFGELLPETTLCVLVGAGVRDYHGVASTRNFLLYFATADSMARGEIAGTILFKDKPDSAGVAELFKVAGDTTMVLRSSMRARVAFAGRDGRFALRGLPTDGTKFILRGFIDTDGDGRYAEGREFSTVRPDTFSLDRFRPTREDVRIVIIDPNEPGSLEGRVVNETAFRIPATIRLAPTGTQAAEAAGARPAPLATRADTTGAFVIARVPPGSYILSAFIDIAADTLCGVYYEPADSTTALNEPCITLPDTVRIGPGEHKTLEAITLK